jgi:hypothetical protein
MKDDIKIPSKEGGGKSEDFLRRKRTSYPSVELVHPFD